MAMKTRESVPTPPRGLARLRWYGPGILWMLSAVGTGSILFTPRVASLYRYELLWLLLVVVALMWVMIREMARFPIVTGRSMLEGMSRLPGPRDWAVWLIGVPQLAAAAVGIAGLSAIVGSALAAFLPGAGQPYALATVLACVALSGLGQYRLVERVSRYMALVLFLLALVSAARVFPDLTQLSGGLRIQWPDDSNLDAILPWIGTILAGSMGILWFSYWTSTRGYGGGLTGPEPDEEQREPHDSPSEDRTRSTTPESPRARVEAWVGVMSGAAAVGVIGGGLVICAFLVLGSELLAPAGILPEGADVAVDLARLFSEVWGPAGAFIMLAAVVIALGGSVLANQDGWGRSFADMTLILLRARDRVALPPVMRRGLRSIERRTGRSLRDRTLLKRLYIFTVTGLAPLVILSIFEDPVRIMSASGIIAAAHTPFIAFTALAVNLTQLPKPHRPGIPATMAMLIAGLFYLGFAVVTLVDR